jgi:ADP-ribosyl-[dinitrogen reductase] hydrolase
MVVTSVASPSRPLGTGLKGKNLRSVRISSAGPMSTPGPASGYRSASMDVAERVVGCVVGLALGDALGAPFRFRRARDVPTPLPAGSPEGPATGATAMARNLARSLADREGFDPGDLVERHRAWFESDPPGVEALTRRVLQRVASGSPAPQAARAVWEERGPEVSAGNGSVAYCAPLGVAYALRPEALPRLAPELSALTHHDQRCRTAVLAVTLAVAALTRGDPPDEALALALAGVLPRDGGEELEFLAEAAGTVRPVDGPDRGFCLFTAALALQVLHRGGGVQEELSRVVALGGDTAANAAASGAVLGARDGRPGLPPDWLNGLSDEHAIEAEARRLVPVAVATR